MTPVEVLTEFRSQVDDRAQPYLWSEDEALRYLIDAQDALAREQGGISDVTVPAASVGTPATRLADLVLAADDPYSAVSPYVLRIRSGRLVTAGRDVPFVSESDMALARERDYGWTQGLTFDDEDTGDVRHGVLGVREGYVRWVRVPASADTCRLHVMRMPLPRLPTSVDSLAATHVLEVSEEHHLHLVKWMKHLAYAKQDGEAYDKKQAEACGAEFMAYCSRAKAIRDKRQYKPRSVQYGGL